MCCTWMTEQVLEDQKMYLKNVLRSNSTKNRVGTSGPLDVFLVYMGIFLELQLDTLISHQNCILL